VVESSVEEVVADDAAVSATSEQKSTGIKSVLITEQQIQAAIHDIAVELDEICGGETPLMVGVLTGAVTFMADLMRAMRSHVQIDFMAVSSYGDATSSSGVVRILKDLNQDIAGRHVIVVEDIVDSGLTLQYLLDHLRRRDPARISVVALLRKDKQDAIDVQVDRVGFDIPDEFVVGYGLDYAGRYRNLPFIGVLHEDAIQKS
jgi:hypoxanthine phosphoribosyltransferase